MSPDGISFHHRFKSNFIAFDDQPKLVKTVFWNRLKETVLRKFMINSWKEYGEIPIVAMVMKK